MSMTNRRPKQLEIDFDAPEPAPLMTLHHVVEDVERHIVQVMLRLDPDSLEWGLHDQGT